MHVAEMEGKVSETGKNVDLKEVVHMAQDNVRKYGQVNEKGQLVLHVDDLGTAAAVHMGG